MALQDVLPYFQRCEDWEGGAKAAPEREAKPRASPVAASADSNAAAELGMSPDRRSNGAKQRRRSSLPIQPI